MNTNKIKLADIIQRVSETNKELMLTNKELVLGISIDKEFMPSVANLNGTDLSKYNVLRKNRFAYNPMHVGRDERLPIALYRSNEVALISPAYEMFEIKPDSQIDLDYLMLVFKTSWFDKACWFYTDSSVRGGLSYSDFCNIEINLLSLDEQKKLVRQYNTIVNRIDVLERLNEKLLALEKVLYWNFLKENSDRQELKNINELFEIKYGKGLPTEKLMDDGFLVYGGNGIIGKYSKCLYEKPQILVSCRGASSGAVLISLENIFVTSNSLVMELKDYDLFDFYRLYFLDNPLYEYVTGSAQPQLTIDSLNKCQIPVFDKSDLLPLTSKLHSIWKLKNCNMIEIMKLNEFRQTFLKNI